MGPLISERDLYLAWSLKRSKAVNGARRVVGVVGKGHLRGVCYALTHDAGAEGPLGRRGRLALAAVARGAQAALGQASADCLGLPHTAHSSPALPCAAPRAAGADLRFRDLVGGKNVKADRKRQRAAAVGRFAAETALLGLLWWAWTELLQPQLQL